MRKSCSIFIWVFYTILFDIIEYKMLYKFRKKNYQYGFWDTIATTIF